MKGSWESSGAGWREWVFTVMDLTKRTWHICGCWMLDFDLRGGRGDIPPSR